MMARHRRHPSQLAFALVVCLFAAQSASSCVQQDPPFTRTEDVVYGRKHGTALTLDVFKPKEKANGLGLIFVVSGGWFSRHEFIPEPLIRPFTDRGYTVFAVVHGSQPKFTIPEVLEDMHRAVRFIRHNAKTYGIDPDRIGIYGASAGGHLSLMMGTAGKEGDPKATDAVDRASSRVQAVACFFPPTDFLNYGEPGVVALGTGVLKDFRAPFDFHEFSGETKAFERITDEDRRQEIGRQISPVNHVTSDDPPMLIIHGDADKLVPIQQAELIVEKGKKEGVQIELITKEGGNHGWPGIEKDLEKFADWFDQHLAKKTPAPSGEDKTDEQDKN